MVVLGVRRVATASAALVVDRFGSEHDTLYVRDAKRRLIWRAMHVLSFSRRAIDPWQPCFSTWLDGHPHAARTMWHGLRDGSPDAETFARATYHRGLSKVFLSLFQRAHLLREPKALKAFVISITTRTLCREFRGRWLGRTLQWQFANTEANTLTVQPDPESREGLRQLGGILDRFNDQDRRAFVLYCLEGMALEDVAAALHVSLATAKRRLSRVRNRVMLMARRDDALVDYLTEIHKDGACTPGIERHRLNGVGQAPA